MFRDCCERSRDRATSLRKQINSIKFFLSLFIFLNAIKTSIIANHARYQMHFAFNAARHEFLNKFLAKEFYNNTVSASLLTFRPTVLVPKIKFEIFFKANIE